MKEILYKDIGKIILIEYFEAYINFYVYDIVRYSESKNGKVDIPFFPTKGSSSSMDTTENIKEAKIYISGTIKWDACSHVYFAEEDNGYIHLCGGYDWRNFRELFDRLYKIAAEYFTKDHQKECFDEYFEKIVNNL